jgi:hypothetical protein
MRFNGGVAILFIAWLGIPSLSAEEAASPTFWDQVSALSLREDQATQMSGLQTWWKARQAALSAARGSNVPPDVFAAGPDGPCHGGEGHQPAPGRTA